MQRIAIIGGGFTALTLAYRLSQKTGYEITIFERNSELGGLASGFQIEGTSLEKAYHHIFKTDTDIIQLVKELGLEDKLKWHDSSVAIYYEGKLYPFMTPVDLIKFTPLPFLDRIRAGMVVFFLQKFTNWKIFTKVSAYDWMRKWSGKNVLKVIWEPLLFGKFDKFYKGVSMAWLWARIHIRANSKQKGDSGEKLGYFDGGFNIIVKKLENELINKGVKIVLNANVEYLKESEERAIVKVNNEEFKFDRIVATVPSHVFAKLIESNNEVDSNYIESLKSINYLGAICLIFSSTQDLSKFYWHNINDTESPFLVFINHTKLVGRENYNNMNVYYIGTYIPHDHQYFNMTDEEVTGIWFEYLKKIFPDFNANDVKEKFMFKFKNAQHIVDLDYEAKIPEYKTPLKNIYLSNFSQIFPEDRGTNFAVREGNKLAELIT